MVPFVEAGWIIRTVLVQDEGSSHCAQLEQPMPIGGVARQTRDFQAHDDARLAHRDFAHKQLESIAMLRLSA
jgi:hypothetical protein